MFCLVASHPIHVQVSGTTLAGAITDPQGGAVVDAITRSGTNAFHGDAFEFVRNDNFDANQFFNNARSYFAV